MWIWRRVTKTSWKDKKSNDEVLKQVGESRSLVNTVIGRKRNWIGHVLRGDGLLLEVMEGRMEGKRTRGRKRKSMLDDVQEEDYVHMKSRAQDSVRWRKSVRRTCH